MTRKEALDATAQCVPYRPFLVYRDAPARGFYPVWRRGSGKHPVRGWQPYPHRFHADLATMLYYNRKDLRTR
jgi:hypothetical protein